MLQLVFLVLCSPAQYPWFKMFKSATLTFKDSHFLVKYSWVDYCSQNDRLSISITAANKIDILLSWAALSMKTKSDEKMSVTVKIGQAFLKTTP